MREASISRTVTDTDSYAFHILTFNRQREDDRGTTNQYMFKPIQRIWAIIAALSAALSAYAYDFYADGIYYNITDTTA